MSSSGSGRKGWLSSAEAGIAGGERSGSNPAATETETDTRRRRRSFTLEKGNRASRVFQQLHATVAPVANSSNSVSASLGGGISVLNSPSLSRYVGATPLTSPHMLQRSVTDGDAVSRRSWWADMAVPMALPMATEATASSCVGPNRDGGASRRQQQQQRQRDLNAALEESSQSLHESSLHYFGQSADGGQSFLAKQPSSVAELPLSNTASTCGCSASSGHRAGGVRGASAGEVERQDEEAAPLLAREPRDMESSSPAVCNGGLCRWIWTPYRRMYCFLGDEKRVDVFKAVLAYAVAALFVFVPVLREWLGDPEYISPHLVTNAAIWFHAAKTRSGLAEGGLVGMLWVCLTSLVTYSALNIAAWVHAWCVAVDGPTEASAAFVTNKDGVAQPLAWQSKLVSLGVFIFGYSWMLAFFKANANRPSVGTATAIANIALYLVMLREAPVVNFKDIDGGVGESVGKKTEHVLVAVLTGMAVSLVIGWTVRPSTAARGLRRQLQSTLGSFQSLLPQLLAPIVSAQVPASMREAKLHGAKPAELKDGLRAHRQQLVQLRRQVDAVSLEPTEWGVWARRSQVGELVGCLDGLSLHLSALSCGLELRTVDAGANVMDDTHLSEYVGVVRRIRAPVLRLGAACDEALKAVSVLVDEALSEGPMVLAEERINALGCEIVSALHIFQADYDAAVSDLPGSHSHSSKEEGSDVAETKPSTELPSYSQSGAGTGGGLPATEEQLFIVYFFVFSLREFVDEIVGSLLPAVAAVCRQPPTPRQAVIHEAGKLWHDPRRLVRHARKLGRWALGWLRVLCDTGATTELETRYEVEQFADPRSLHAHRPATSIFQRLARGVWRFCMWARRLNVKFATKYALLVTLLSLPCYWSLDVYWEFRRHRLDWMVISAAAIMVPTVGGSALVSVYRVLGTCAGGLAAFLAYEVSKDMPWLTYLLLVLFSVPCFQIILHGRYPKIGQFALITFGVVLINKCVAREDQAESAADLAIRRTSAVALGVLAGMLVTLYVWPYEARVRVRQALSWWMLTALLLYDRLWNTLWTTSPGANGKAANSAVAGSGTEREGSPVSATDSNRTRSTAIEWSALSTVREYLDGELQLQNALVEIRGLLSDTLNEPRLKGPFPIASYQRIINACQRLLDAMVAARWVMLPVPVSVVVEHLHREGSVSDSDSDSNSESECSSAPREDGHGSRHCESAQELRQRIAYINNDGGSAGGNSDSADDNNNNNSHRNSFSSGSDSSSDGASMLSLPIDLASAVRMEREQQMEMDERLSPANADSRQHSSGVGTPYNFNATMAHSRAEIANADGEGYDDNVDDDDEDEEEDEEKDVQVIRACVEQDLLRRTAGEREHRDALLSLTMYVLASALILKTPLPSVLPPIHAAQRRVAEAMEGILDANEQRSLAVTTAAGVPGTLSESSRRAVMRIRYVFYYTQVMVAWEVVQELSIIGGLMRELYGSYGSFGQLNG